MACDCIDTIFIAYANQILEPAYEGATYSISNGLVPPTILSNTNTPSMQTSVHHMYAHWISNMHGIFSGPPQIIGGHPFPGNCDCCFFAIKINQWTAALNNNQNLNNYQRNRIMARIMWAQMLYQEPLCLCGSALATPWSILGHPYSDTICPYPFTMNSNVATPGVIYQFPPSPYGYPF